MPITNNLKHVGQLVNTQRRCVVVFREIPDDPNHCLIVDTDALPDWMHDDVINAVQSVEGQNSAEFYEYAARTMFTDGSQMLNTMHARGLLKKHATTNVSMTPNRETSVLLSELNKLIREQNGDQPAITENADTVSETSTPSEPETLDNTDIAQGMLTQADQFEAEATRLREEAYELAPELKPKKRGRKAKADATA